jgi:hypothetical protein
MRSEQVILAESLEEIKENSAEDINNLYPKNKSNEGAYNRFQRF